MQKEEQTKLNEKIGQCIRNSQHLISRKALDSILHYYNHAEYEMAFEGLLIELVLDNKYPKEFCFDEWIRVGEKCQIDKLPSFDDAVWNKFTVWGQLYQRNLNL